MDQFYKNIGITKKDNTIIERNKEINSERNNMG